MEMMDSENDPQDGADDGGEIAALEARIAACEEKLGIGQSASAPSIDTAFGGKPKAGGTPGSPFYGG